MFGYLRIEKSAPKDVRSYFKYAYCSLCKALQKEYGFVGRLFLSFDVTVLAIAIKDAAFYEDYPKIHCVAKKTKSQEDEDFSLLSAINVFLAREKIVDNIADSKSSKYKLAYKMLKKTFRKADDRYGDISNMISDFFIDFRRREKCNDDIMSLACFFGNMMKRIGQIFNLDAAKLNQLALLGRWVYFIDAVDDYKTDIAKNEFNPFKRPFDGQPLRQKADEVVKVYKNIYSSHLLQTEFLDLPNRVIEYLMNVSIPNMTYKVLKNAFYE